MAWPPTNDFWRFYLRTKFLQEIWWEEVGEEIFLNFLFWWRLNEGFTNNKPAEQMSTSTNKNFELGTLPIYMRSKSVRFIPKKLLFGVDIELAAPSIHIFWSLKLIRLSLLTSILDSSRNNIWFAHDGVMHCFHITSGGDDGNWPQKSCDLNQSNFSWGNFLKLQLRAN